MDGLVDKIVALGYCPYGYGKCTAPDTKCPHWLGICCELDEASGYAE